MGEPVWARYRPKIGTYCEIATWDNTSDGWKPTTVRGMFAGMTGDAIYLMQQGATLSYSRPRWEFVID